MAHTAYTIDAAHPAQGCFPRNGSHPRLLMSDCTHQQPINLESRGMVDVETAALYLDVPTKTIRYLIDEKKLKAKKVSRYLRISVASLKSYAESQ